MHGGATPRGVASANYKHGRYSSDLPTRMVANYEELRTDPDYLELGDEIAVTDSRIRDLMQMSGAGESKNRWGKLQKTWVKLQAKISAGDDSARREFSELITNSLNDFAIWNEISELFEQRRRLVETQRKCMIDSQNYVSSEKAFLLIGAVMKSIKNHIKDREILQLIGSEIRQLTG